MKMLGKVLLILLIVVMMIIGLAGCGKKNTKTISGKEVAKLEIEDKLTEINNDFISKLWNKLFCEVSWYTYNGKGAAGKKFDLDEALKIADETMKKKYEYDKYINELDSSYDEIKEVWNILLPEAERLYKQIKSDKPQAKDKDYKLDLNKYNTYMYDYAELVEEKRGNNKGKLTDDVDENLTIIWNNFICEMWNELFCNVSHYLYDGLDATGQEFYFDRAMKKAEKAMNRKEEYDKYINSLDSEYDEVKDVWNKLLPETEKLYVQIKGNRPKAKDKDYNFDTEVFQEYMEEYQDLM